MEYNNNNNNNYYYYYYYLFTCKLHSPKINYKVSTTKKNETTNKIQNKAVYTATVAAVAVIQFCCFISGLASSEWPVRGEH
jgi:hypothetical protein